MVAHAPRTRKPAAALRTRLRRAVPVLRVLGFLVCLGIVVAIAVEAVRELPNRDLRWGLIVAALPPTVVWWVLLAAGWAVLARGRWNLHDAGTWFRTQALRYLPGGIWAPVSRVAVVGGHALDRVSTVAAENVAALAAALTVGGAAMAFSGRWAWSPLVLAAAGPPLLARFTRDRTRVAPDRVRRVTAGYVAGFAAYVVAAVLVQAAVSGWHDVALVAGAAALAWAAGLIVVIAPSGLGARELAYVALLGSQFPSGDGAAGAVTLRLVTIAAELAVLVTLGRPTPAAAADPAGPPPAGGPPPG